VSRDRVARRWARAFKARYGPRGGASDRRPAVVREDRGAARRLLRIVRMKGQ
jgi:hypothetical protein